MRTNLIHPGELGPEEIKAWKAITAEMGTHSAFMEPEFARAAGQARGDARVAVFENDGKIVGFWPFHKRPMHFARPIGAPFSDQHGPAIRPGAAFDPAAAREHFLKLQAALLEFYEGDEGLERSVLPLPEDPEYADNMQALTFTLSGAEVDELERMARQGKQATQNIFQTD